MHIRLILALALAASPALAEPLSPEAFAARVLGRTITWSTADGRPHGIEQYLPDRQVIWRFGGEDCQRGHWFGDGGLVCFVYEDLPGLQCWRFREGDGGLTALAEGAPPEDRLVATAQSRAPIDCPGPWLGS